MYPQRFSSVPWLNNAMDLKEGRKFAWEIEYQRDRDRATCMAVLEPFQEGDMYLIVHAVRGNGNDGGLITLAISPSPLYDVYAKEVFRLHKREDA